MRLRLVVNVRAQSVTPRAVDVIERALSSEFKVDLVRTKRREHATHLARGAVHEGFDLVVAMGGDGTVNEVANGLAGSPTPMSVIPAGGTNVLARSLGIPKDPIEATGHLIASRDHKPRRVPLGRAEGRYFAFSCGLGFDGAIVREVERRQLLKKGMGEWYYVWSGLRLYFAGVDRSKPPVHLRWGRNLEHRRDGLFVAISQKTRPFAYLGDREMHICPLADLDLGLDLLSLDSFSPPTVLRVVAQMFTSGSHLKNKHVFYLHDQERIEVASDIPLPMQMDGEYVGDRTRILLEAVPDALSILY